MKYLILMTSPEGVWEGLSESEQQDVIARHNAFTAKLRAEGRYVTSYRAHDEARSVRKDAAGNVTTTSEPFTGAQERVGGFYVIEAESLDEATRWGEVSRFTAGTNEVRPLYD